MVGRGRGERDEWGGVFVCADGGCGGGGGGCGRVCEGRGGAGCGWVVGVDWREALAGGGDSMYGGIALPWMFLPLRMVIDLYELLGAFTARLNLRR